MGIKLDFDSNMMPQTPTFVLATRNGTKIGKISNITGVRLKPSMKDPEAIFTVNKYDGKDVIPYWDDIVDFKLCWCKETDTWFEITIDISESDEITKQVSLQRLGEAELSQTRVYGLEVNTEDDIIRGDYLQPTVFYNEEEPTASLLHRIMGGVPHYRIRHIDEHLKGIQKIFSFHDKTVKECFDEIEESMDILFVYESQSREDGTPDRTIDIYDLKSYCKDCGARGKFVDHCLNCGSENITEGYGVDTTIFVSCNDLGRDINIKINTDEVKNCYHLEGGDELMTATIINCNPNGTPYIWDFADTTKGDMDISLVEKIEQYKEDYDYYKSTYRSDLSSLSVSGYNTLVDKYNPTSEDLKVSKITNIIGYSPIMQHYYDTIDFAIYLESGLLPNIALQDTNAQIEAAKLTADKFTNVAIMDEKYMTLSNASTAVLNAAKLASDPRYQIKVNESSLSGNIWVGNFTVTNYSDERDTYSSPIIHVAISDDYETYINQKLKKTLYNGSRGKHGNITKMIDMDIPTFQAELRKYNLTALSSFNTCFSECVNLLSEQGIDKEDADLYYSVYLPVYNKIAYIQAEITVRENELNTVQSIQDKLLELKRFINEKLNLETYLGTDMWLDFCAYRREDTYSNGNYISDYLSNKDLFVRAEEFMVMAEYEISKSSNYRHEITASLKNLLTVSDFRPLVDYFECGNWIRVIDNNGEVYKLRLIDYEVDFDNLDDISVTFSDVARTIDGLEPVKEILVKSTDIINNYNAAMNRTNSNFDNINDSLLDMVADSNFNYDMVYDDINKEISDTIVRIDKNTDSIMIYVGELTGDISSQIEVLSDNIGMMVRKDGVMSAINMSPEEICILANKIKLEGYVTVNEGFAITEEGDVIANGGQIAGFKIGKGYMCSGDPTGEDTSESYNFLRLSTADMEGKHTPSASIDLGMYTYEDGSSPDGRKRDTIVHMRGDGYVRFGLAAMDDAGSIKFNYNKTNNNDLGRDIEYLVYTKNFWIDRDGNVFINAETLQHGGEGVAEKLTGITFRDDSFTATYNNENDVTYNIEMDANGEWTALVEEKTGFRITITDETTQ
ncbi:MAG: hypothetical protein PUC73_05420 [Lachnospiraceae bacterium]|nr:hypothetical protein [Lachnospiraceae bacterium]